MSYTESTNVIVIDDALPMSDEEGKVSSNYFDFSVTSNSNTNIDIYYEVSIEKLDVDTNYNSLDNKDIKVYLENKDNNEVLLEPTLISDLSNSFSNENYLLIYATIHSHNENTNNIITNYRLRAWIDYNTDASNWNETNKYEYKFRVNINTNENNGVSGFASECFTYKLDNETMTATITDYLCGEDSIEQLSYTNDKYYVMPLSATLENNTAITDFEVPETVYASDDEYVYYIDPKNYEDEEMVNKCVNSIMSLAEEEDMTEEELQEIETMYTSLCSGGSLDGVYLTLDYIATYDPEALEEMGLVKIGMVEKVGSITYKVVDNPTEEAINNCIAVFANVGLVSYSETVCNVGDNPDESLLAMLLEEDNSTYGILLANTGIVDVETTPYKLGFFQNYVVTAIGDKAFYGKGLTNVILSDTITSIGVGAFTDNKIPEENAYFYARTDSDSDGVAEIDYTTLVSYGGTGENVIIPDSVTTIESYAFNYEKLSDNSLITVETKRKCFTYTTSDSSLTITDWTCTDIYNPIIPDVIDGYNVTTIGTEAFYANSLKKITIPDSVTLIEKKAFQSNRLTNLIIPDKIVAIGEYAFYYNDLISLDLGNVKTIGEYAFYHNNLTSLVIPDSVTTIGENAFYNNQLTSLDFGNSASIIGDYSFYENSLTSLNLGKTASIGEYAFYKNSLTSLVIPDSVTSIGNSAFEYNDLTSLDLGNGLKTIGAWAFRDNNLVSVTIPNSVTKIGARAFQSNNLTSITIPKTVTSIGVAVVNGNKLPDDQAYIYLRLDKNKDGVAEIDYSTIISYGGVKSDITIPSEVEGVTVTTIYYYAFQSSNLTSVFIPDTIKSIENAAFSYNSNLTSIVIDSNNTTYDSRNNSNAIIETSTNKLIQGCKNTIIPNDVTTIGMAAFIDMGVTTIEIPNSVVTIGSSAFYNNNLTNLIIPDSVTTIESFAFRDNNLSSLTLGNNVTTIESYAFDGNTLTSVVIPDSVETIESYAFYNNNLEYVVIGENSNLTENTGIEGKAFYSVYYSGVLDSNKNLTTIYNNSGRSFDWTNVVTGDEGTTFITGTVSAQYNLGSRTVTITTGYPE